MRRQSRHLACQSSSQAQAEALEIYLSDQAEALLEMRAVGKKTPIAAKQAVCASIEEEGDYAAIELQERRKNIQMARAATDACQVL